MTAEPSVGDAEIVAPRTNEQRRAARWLARCAAPVTPSPLLQLGTWVWVHDHRVTGAPVELLQAAERHLVARLEIVAARPPSARTRASARWLARWLARVQEELRCG